MYSKPAGRQKKSAHARLHPAHMTAARKSLARTSLVLFKDWMVSNSPMQFFRPIIRDGASKSKFFSRIAHPARGHAKGATRRRETSCKTKSITSASIAPCTPASTTARRTCAAWRASPCARRRAARAAARMRACAATTSASSEDARKERAKARSFLFALIGMRWRLRARPGDRRTGARRAASSRCG